MALVLGVSPQDLSHYSLVCTDVINASNYSPSCCTLLHRSDCSSRWKSHAAHCTTALLTRADLCSAVRLSVSRHVSTKVQAARSVVSRSALSTSSLIAPKVASISSCGLYVILRMGHRVLPRQYILLRITPSPWFTANIILWLVWSLGFCSPAFLKSPCSVPSAQSPIPITCHPSL